MALIGLMMTGTQSVPLRCQVLSNNRCSAGPSAIGWEDLGGGPCLLLVNEPSSQQPRGASSCRSSPHILPGSCVAPLPPGPEPEGRVASQAHRLALIARSCCFSVGLNFTEHQHQTRPLSDSDESGQKYSIAHTTKMTHYPSLLANMNHQCFFFNHSFSFSLFFIDNKSISNTF